MRRPAGAVILAAGASRRMGRPKLPLDLHGRPVLAWVVDRALDVGLDPVVVVSRLETGANHLPAAIRRVQGGESQGESLAAGLQALPDGCERAVVLLGDMPLVTARTVRLLLDRQAEPDCDAAAADHHGVPGPPLVVHRSFFPRFASGPGPDRQAALAALGPRLARVPVPASELLDIDTPDDYWQVVRLAGAPA